MTEGAQEGLLCVHTTDVCIHCTFCLWGNVTVPTLVRILVGPQFNHYGCLNESRSRHPHICQLFNLLFFLHWLCLHRSGRSRRSRSRGHHTLQLHQKLRQLPWPHLLTHMLKQCPALCHHPVSSSHCTNS